jgi:hypothetical protein
MVDAYIDLLMSASFPIRKLCTARAFFDVLDGFVEGSVPGIASGLGRALRSRRGPQRGGLLPQFLASSPQSLDQSVELAVFLGVGVAGKVAGRIDVDDAAFLLMQGLQTAVDSTKFLFKRAIEWIFPRRTVSL